MTDTSAVGSQQSGSSLGAKLIAALSTSEANDPWLDGRDDPELVLGDVIDDALTDPDIADDLKSIWEFRDDKDRAVKVRESLEESKNAIFAAGANEETIYRQLASLARPATQGKLGGAGRPLELWLRWVPSVLLWIAAVGLALYWLGLAVGHAPVWGLVTAAAGLAITVGAVVYLVRPAVRHEAATVLFGLALAYVFFHGGLNIWVASGGSLVTALFFRKLAMRAMYIYYSVAIGPAEARLTSSKEIGAAARDAFDRWRSALRTHGVMPALTTLINERLEDQYSTRLRYRTEFLSRPAPDGKLHQRTPVGRQLVELFGTLRSGSFAISGTRGAGKSDLIAAFCRGTYQKSRRRDVVVAVSAPVVYQPADFMLYLHAELCDQVISYVKIRDGGAVEQVNRRRETDRRRLLRFLVNRPTLAGWAAVLYRAYKRKDEIRYLLTFGSEISGQLGLGTSHLGGKASVSRAEQPRTYPQIVNRLRRDLEFVAERLVKLDGAEDGQAPRLIITIDELDRIQSGELALQFINEIKAIFRVPNCYFLVSVSEDALQDFELAAMGMRTAIDSAFDEVLWVDYLDYDLSRKLLNNYVVGLSEQFMAFAYVRSGGLARQLVRTARELINWAAQSPSLSSVVGKLAESDLRRVSTAVKGSLTKVSDRGSVAALVRALDDYPEGELSQQVLMDYADRLVNCNIGVDSGARDLRDTMAARTLYLATMIGVFSSDLDDKRVKKGTEPAVPGESFNALARVRRYLGVNPQAAMELLGDFRQHWGMARVDLTPLNATAADGNGHAAPSVAEVQAIVSGDDAP
ncbi:MAG TPA: hypothetical protein VGR06_28835 [Actinophytocola sp.]|uniref:hypothetical protein n=1 Tax=Actinophytocola sp. TaxID=1872138 RepID=UPI002DF7AFFA|nr:hypothetical protein [Actinophytocola sp.]